MSKRFEPQVMAAFANLAIWVLRRLGEWNRARAVNNFKLRPSTAVGPRRRTPLPRQTERLLANRGRGAPA